MELDYRKEMIWWSYSEVLLRLMFRLRLPENSGSDNKYIHSYLKLTFHYTQLPNEVIKFRCYVFIHMTYIMPTVNMLMKRWYDTLFWHSLIMSKHRVMLHSYLIGPRRRYPATGTPHTPERLYFGAKQPCRATSSPSKSCSVVFERNCLWINHDAL